MTRIIDLINWCNQQAERLERGHETIPSDSEGPVTVRRFRRTLAWFVYRKPGGRIALGVQYGHLRLLTHRHTDLQEEFRARIANEDSEPPVLRALHDEKVAAERRAKALTADVTALRATIHQLERIIHVLALENHQFRSGPPESGKVLPLRAAERQ